MASFYRGACPFCNEEAEYCYVDARNRKYYKCPRCSYFQISRRAEEILQEESPQLKQIYASRSPEAPEGSLFVVLMPTAIHRMEHPDDKLEAAFINKSDLPLNCE